MFQMKFVVHTPESALPGSARGSEKRANAFGFVPNLLGVTAEAPIALSAYIDLTDLLGKASLNAVEQQVMMLQQATRMHAAIAWLHTAPPQDDRDAGTCPDGAPLPGNLPNPKFEAVRSS
jgi:hypothetical protein